MVRSIFLAVAALSCLAANRPEPTVGKAADKVTADQEVGDISGYYTCKGQELSGKSYSGVCVISRKNDVYIIQWMVGAGSTFTGIGIRQGNTLAASWAIPADKAGVVRGVNLYKIESGPRLVGRWTTLPGSGYLQSETLTFLKAIDTEDE